MNKHTPTAGALPNASIDFDKVNAAAKAGKDDIFDGAVSKERNAGEAVPEAAETAAAPAAGKGPEADER